MKLLFSGSSGSGKTTMAKWVEKEFGIPFISTSAKALWPKYGIISHQQSIKMFNENPQLSYRFQCELLEMRAEIFERNPNLVSDRSPIDNIVYFFLQNLSQITQEKTDNYIKLCVEQLKDLVIIHCAPLGLHTGIEDDGYRIVNEHYQYFVDNVFTYVNNVILGNVNFNSYGLHRFRLDSSDLLDRKLLIKGIMRYYK